MTNQCKAGASLGNEVVSEGQQASRQAACFEPFLLLKLVILKVRIQLVNSHVIITFWL
jgi:hypothetical protein